MTRSLSLLTIIVVLLVACQSALSPIETQEAIKTDTAFPLPFSTSSNATSVSSQPTSTRTIEPTSTVTPIPSPTITPIAVTSATPNPLVLNEDNAGTDMRRLARIGQGALNDIEWSPDGKYLAIATGLGVFLYDAITLDQVGLIDTNDDATVIAFSLDGKEIAIALGTKIEVWNVNSAQRIIRLDGEIRGGIWKIAFGNNGLIAAYGQIAPGLGESVAQFKIWQLSTGQLIYSDDKVGGRTVAVDINPDGKTMIFLGSDGLAIRDIKTVTTIRDVKGNFDAFYNADGSKLFTTSWEWWNTGKMEIWMINLPDGEQSQILKDYECQYLAHNDKAAICYSENQVVQFDPSNGTFIKSIPFTSSIKNAIISPDGNSLAVMENDSVVIIDAVSDQVIKDINFNPFEHLAVGLIHFDNADRYVAAVGGENGTIQIRDLINGDTIRQFQINNASIKGLAFGPDRLTLASIDSNSILQLWNIQDELQTYQFDLGTLHADGPLVFSPDGLKLAMTDIYQDNNFEFYLQSGGTIKKGWNPSGYVYSYTVPYGWYSYDSNNHLITWEGRNNVLVLKNLSTNETITLPLKSPGGYLFIETIALSLDGNYLAAGMNKGGIFIWDLRSKTIIWELKGHETRYADGWEGTIRGMFFNPYSDLLVSVGWDGTTRLWNIHTGTQLRELDVCCFAQFSPDGRILVTSGQGVIRVWGIPPWP
jgi:WD40 repeat protein